MVRSCGRVLAFLTTLLVLLCAMQPAFAADDATARAKQHFENAIHLYDQKPPDYEGALAEFRAAEKEHPSPGIKKNIALCLKALHRYGEAVDELEAMLAAGDAVKPETREAGQKLLTELQALIATVRLKIILHKSDNQLAEVPHVDVSVDGAAIASDKLGAPVRVGPGDHLFFARAAGYGDTTKKVSVVSGDHDVPVQLDLMPIATSTALGTLRIHASDPKATISIDGVALANGTWDGALPAGRHHIEAHVDGQPTWARDVDVAAGGHVDLEATIGDRSTNAPAPYAPSGPEKPKAATKPDRRWYMQGGFAGMTGTQTVSQAEFFESAPETDRGFNGLGLVAKVGRRVSKNLSLEAWGEIGVFKPINYDAGEATFGYGQLGPELRIHSSGNFRIFAGTGLGLEVDSVTNNGKNGHPSNKGTGVEGAWLLETGAQFHFGERYYFEASLMMDISGNGAIRDASTSDRYFFDSPWVRGGLRVQFGFDL